MRRRTLAASTVIVTAAAAAATAMADRETVTIRRPNPPRVFPRAAAQRLVDEVAESLNAVDTPDPPMTPRTRVQVTWSCGAEVAVTELTGANGARLRSALDAARSSTWHPATVAPPPSKWTVGFALRGPLL
jgi:hypothetical protein